jgi:L-alanine-DL-glutamate epimerase-like enolase superfamily enzyme
MKILKEKNIAPVLADESIFNFNDAKKIVEEEYADMLNIKLMKSGGIHEALKISQLAQQHHTKCMIGSMLEGPISLLAATHFALSQEITMADLDSPLYLKTHPLLEPFHMQGETITLNEELGLGVDSILNSLELFQTQ